MIAIPAMAILLTHVLRFIALDFWEKIRAVCKLVMERTGLGPEIASH